MSRMLDRKRRRQVTLAILPAEEILVRGSEASTDQSETLLKAAMGQETPKEELLWMSQESKS